MTALADVSLGLATDGGYWSIGLRHAVDTAAFLHSGIAWSTDRAAADTLARARALGLTILTDGPWDDVDTRDDLRRLLVRLAASPDPAGAACSPPWAPSSRDVAARRLGVADRVDHVVG